MQKIIALIPLYLFSCGSSDEEIAVSTPEDTYYSWVSARIKCDQILAFEQLSDESKRLTSVEYLEKSSLFSCDSFYYKLISKKHVLVNTGDSLPNYKRYHFDMSIKNLTTSEIIDRSTNYTFEKIGENWYLIYLAEKIDSLWNVLFNEEVKPDYNSVCNSFRELLLIDPLDPYLHICLAESLTGLGDFQNAEISFETAIAYSYEVPIWFYGSFGEMYTAQNEYAKAIEKYKIALTKSPDKRDSSYNYCRITRDFDLMGLTDSSNFYYEYALKTDPENNWANFDLAVMYGELSMENKMFSYYDLAYHINDINYESDFIGVKSYINLLIKKASAEEENTTYILKAKNLCSISQKYNAVDPELILLIDEINELWTMNQTQN